MRSIAARPRADQGLAKPGLASGSRWRPARPARADRVPVMPRVWLRRTKTARQSVRWRALPELALANSLAPARGLFVGDSFGFDVGRGEGEVGRRSRRGTVRRGLPVDSGEQARRPGPARAAGRRACGEGDPEARGGRSSACRLPGRRRGAVPGPGDPAPSRAATRSLRPDGWRGPSAMAWVTTSNCSPRDEGGGQRLVSRRGLVDVAGQRGRGRAAEADLRRLSCRSRGPPAATGYDRNRRGDLLLPPTSGRSFERKV